MIEKILVHPEYVTAAKYAGIYAHIVDWKSKFERGMNPVWNLEPIRTEPVKHTATGTASVSAPVRPAAPTVISHTPTFPTDIDRPKVTFKTDNIPVYKPEEKITLNPKSLDMAVFNRMFEEYKTSDPDVDDGYEKWLKDESEPSNTYKGTLTKDNFNSVFAEQTKTRKAESKAFVPEALYMHTFSGSELGRDRPANYTKPMFEGGGLGYTDLRYAYSEGSTFSQEVEGLSVANRSFADLEAERSSAPIPLNPFEMAKLEESERMRKIAEEERLKRMKSYDSSYEAKHSALMSRVYVKPM